MKKLVSALLLLAIVSSLFTMPVMAYTNTFRTVTFTKKVVLRTRYTKNTDVYSDKSLRTRIGAIYPTDNVVLLQLDKNVAKVSYPTSRGTKTGWVEANKLLYWDITNGPNCVSQARKKITTYARDDGKQSIGYISKGDIYYNFGGSANEKYSYCLYPVSGGYKVGWIKNSDCSNWDDFLADCQKYGCNYRDTIFK